jgi:hypothetical protein
VLPVDGALGVVILGVVGSDGVELDPVFGVVKLGAVMVGMLGNIGIALYAFIMVLIAEIAVETAD